MRAATAADLAAIQAIEVASFSDPWSTESFAQMLAQPRVRALAATRAGQLVGYCIAWQIADEAEVANIAVREADRGLGIGGVLLDALIADVDAAGGATIYLEVRASNAAAQRLYASRGFAVVGRRAGYYQRPDEDALVLRRAQAESSGGD